MSSSALWNRDEPYSPGAALGLRLVAGGAGTLALLVGLSTFAGWVFALESLKDWSGTGITMKTNTAVCTAILGLAVVIHGSAATTGLAIWSARALAMLAALVGLLTLSEHAVGWDLGIDTLLYTEPPGARATVAPNRMGPNAALSFTALGTALLLLPGRARLSRMVTALLAGLALALSSLALVGYAYGATPLFDLDPTGIALQTAFAIHLLAWGLLALVPQHGVATILLSSGPGGVLARRFIPVAILIPVTIGFVSVAMLRVGWLNPPVGAAVVTLATAITLALLGIGAAARVDRAAGALRESERMLRVVTGHARVGLVIVGPDYRYLFANDAYAEVLGLNTDRIVGRRVPDLMGPAWPQIQPRLDRALAGERVRFELTLPPRLLNPGERFFEVVYEPSATPSGERSVVVAVVDITERRRAEAALRESESRYRAAFDQAPVGVVEMDPATSTILRVNEAYCRILGRPAHQIVGRNPIDFTHPDDRPGDELTLPAKVGLPFQRRKRFVRADGSVVWVNLAGTVVRGEGFPPRTIAVVADVTTEVEASARIRDNQERLRRALEFSQAVTGNMAEGLYTVDTDGLLTSINPAGEALLGWKREDLLGRNMHEATHHSHADGRPFPAGECPIVKVLHDGIAVREHEDTFIRKDGTFFPVVYSASPLTADGQTIGIVVAFRDDTLRRRSEESLRQSRERLGLALHAASMGIWDWDIQRGTVTLSPEMYAVMGLPTGGFDGTIVAFRRLVHPDDVAQMDGAIRAAWSARSAYRHEFRIRRPDGQVRWVCNDGLTEYDAKGMPARMVGTLTDITSRREAQEELARHRERLQQLVDERTAELSESLRRLAGAERLASLGTLSAGLGHDLANLVLPIRARIDSLHHHCPPDAEEDFAAIGRALDHMTSLSAGMRLMAVDPQRDSASTPALDLAQWWNEAQAIFRAALSRRVKLEGDLPPGLGVAMARHRLMQAVFNLVQNAGEALAGRESGLVRIGARPGLDPRGAQVVHLSVADDGPGMAPEVLARCFEPYFSTKGRTIATGMGLAMVRGLAESSGGSVEVRSTPGAGTVFTLTLPAADHHQSANAARDAGRFARGQTAALTITDQRLASLTSMILSRLEVKAATGAPGSVPSAAVWIAEAPGRSEVDRCLAGDPALRIVAIGGIAGADAAAPAIDRVTLLPARPSPGALRDALTDALRAPRPDAVARR